MGIDKNLVQGSMALLLLRLLETKDMYGYEMIEALRSKSNNVFELKAGTLYPLLHSLESKGYVRSYEDASSGKKRRYYQLTEAGRHHSSEKYIMYSNCLSMFFLIQRNGLKRQPVENHPYDCTRQNWARHVSH